MSEKISNQLLTATLLPATSALAIYFQVHQYIITGLIIITGISLLSLLTQVGRYFLSKNK